MFGNPIQFSDFECDLSRRQIEVLERTIRGIITADKDNVRIYPICEKCANSVDVYGGKPLEKNEIFYVI